MLRYGSKTSRNSIETLLKTTVSLKLKNPYTGKEMICTKADKDNLGKVAKSLYTEVCIEEKNKVAFNEDADPHATMYCRLLWNCLYRSERSITDILVLLIQISQANFAEFDPKGKDTVLSNILKALHTDKKMEEQSTPPYNSVIRNSLSSKTLPIDIPMQSEQARF